MAIFQRFFLPFLSGMCALMANAALPYEPIAAFQLGPTGAGRAKLIRHTDGYFYGVSAGGGANGAGTIFKLSPSGDLSTWVNFDGLNGGTKSELVSDGQGAFWGTTFAGGNYQRGSIYKVDIATGKVTTVIDFPTADSPIRGRYVRAGLVYDHAGFFWGTTQQGGAMDVGTLFKVEASTGLLTTVAEFSYGSGPLRGVNPAATLVSDANGVLWGAAAQGGEEGRGTIFKVDPATGTVATVAHFSGT